MSTEDRPGPPARRLPGETTTGRYTLDTGPTAMAREDLEAAGLTRDEKVERLRETLADLRRLRAAKETKFFAHEGIVTDVREVDALGTQMRAVEAELALLGANAPRAVATQVRVDVRYKRPSYLPPVADHTPVESEVESRDVSVACNSNATEEETSLHVSSP